MTVTEDRRSSRFPCDLFGARGAFPLSNIPYFQFDAIAWLSSGSIAQMTLAEEGAYIHLLAHSWNYPDCILPDDISVLRRLARGASSSLVTRVLELGFERLDNGWRNQKIHTEYVKVLKMSHIAREKADTRWKRLKNNKTRNAGAYATAMPGQCTDDANQESGIKNQKEESKALGVEPKKRFSPPTIEEVKLYCETRKNGIDPVKFVAHYAAADWMRGNTKIRNWKQAVITWEQRRKDESNNGGDAMARTAEQELRQNLMNDRNTHAPQMSDDAMKLFRSLGMHWVNLQKLVLEGQTFDQIKQGIAAKPDFKKQAGGDE